MNSVSGHATLQSIMCTHLFEDPNKHRLSPRQWQVCRHIRGCRTEQMGSALLSCTQCDRIKIYHHACRDRHCPQCQQQASKQWSKKQEESLLPVTYHHLVFTLPHEINGWVGLHPELIYKLFFHSVWSTLKRFGENPKYLGGKMGMTSVLHTWGENLSRHVHLHCLIPGGALLPNGDWCEARGNYLFPVRALSRRFRGTMVSRLRQAADTGELHRIKVPGEVDGVLRQLMSKDWVVYSKPCPQRSNQVVQYLARYTHRIAISNQRIEYADRKTVRFSVKEYRQEGKRRSLTLSTEEFIRRFLLHVLPKGLVRIRHYGLLSNRTRREKIALIRMLLQQPAEPACTGQSKAAPNHQFEYQCPQCRAGFLIVRHVNQHGPPC